MEQLDVQLGAGSIQLSDLALNVDYLNQKFGAAAAVIVKEGSIGSLTVQMPWKGKGCEIEVHELELVLAPCLEDNATSNCETSNTRQDDNNSCHASHPFGRLEHETVDVHEGVKTVAKMVKWLLTSFHVKLKKLIVAFDPYSETNDRRPVSHKTVVLRVAETECGTCIDEDDESKNFLGMNRLTNFVKFHGAILEILEMADNDTSTWLPSDSTIPILTGESDGFSGNIRLSIPWKNGSLDIRKVDADVCIDPLELRFQPSTINWFFYLWDCMKNLGKNGGDFSAVSQCHSSTVLSTDETKTNHDHFHNDSSCVEAQETLPDALLPESHLISDWVPFFTNKNQGGGTIGESDLGSSIDQFFECFDEMRSSQSALGNSGIWNWTCSVFSAITAASNLASGSSHISSEQQHVETNLKANVAGISIMFSFHDGDQKQSYEQIDFGSNVDYLGAKFKDVLFVLEVFPQGMKLETTVKHIDLTHYFSSGNDAVDTNEDAHSQNNFIQHLQAEVQGALPPPLAEYADPEKPSELIRVNKDDNDIMKIRLVKTSGVSRFIYILNSSSPNASLTSVSVHLPPFIFWINSHWINMVLDLLKEVNNCFDKKHEMNDSTSEALKENNSLKERLQGNIFIPNARIVLCFPFDRSGDFPHYLSWDRFIAFDLYSPCTILSDEKGQYAKCTRDVRNYSSKMSRLLNMNLGNVDVYLITSAYRDGQKFSANKIVSINNGGCSFSTISMLWQENPKTGIWLAQKAKRLATFEDAMCRNKVKGGDYEFASATTLKNLDSHTRQEIISGSSFFVHIHISLVTVNLDNEQYKGLYCLLNQLMEGLSYEAPKKENCISQTSILVESDSMDFQIILEKKVELTKSSIYSELPGLWHKLNLKVQNFELLSVSNIGGADDSNFLWVSHGEGKLWGSITSLPNQELLLITCSNSTMRRGDGEGSNALSSGFAGSRIIHMSDPDGLCGYTSITVRCATIVALGCRLDWLNDLSSFFTLPSNEAARENDDNLQKGDSFVLNLVDIGLCYEPHLKQTMVNTEVFDPEFGCYTEIKGETDEQYVACLLAASSLNLSSMTVTDGYKIRVQDLGVLLCPNPNAETIDGIYSVHHLHKVGYVKVAGEAVVEATVKTNSKIDFWEVECSDLHIFLDTCHDTFLGLICLVTQFQKLFAPDIEESIGHLQTRWNNLQERNNNHNTIVTDLVPSSSNVGLMDEIREDAFQSDRNQPILQSDLPDSQFRLLIENSFPEFIEGYYLSGLCPLSDLSGREKSSTEDLKCKPKGVGNSAREISGYYGDAAVSIVENHISEACEDDGLKEVLQSSELRGRVTFKNINVRWRMYAGSEWHSVNNSRGRDTSVNLELALHGLDCQYDIFPDGRICVSKLSLSVQDFHLYDNSRNAPWKLVMGYYHSKDHPRKSCSKAFKLELEAVRPNPLTPLEEYRLRLALLPLLLHLHQGQLDFLISFFGGQNSSFDQSTSVLQDSGGFQLSPAGISNYGEHTISEEALLPYFQRFDIWPVLIRVDYTPSRVDLAALRGGKYVELVNLVPWKGVELQLRHVHAFGIYGWSSVCETVLGEWLEDISQNQIHKLLQGLPTIRSLVSVGSGAAKLVSLPVKSYKKDHRLLKGMQRGTIAFLRSISVEAVGLGVHLAAGAHDILLQAEYLLTSIPPSVPWPSRSKTNFRSNQPKDAQQGIQQAYESLSDGVEKSASALVRAPLKTLRHGAGAGHALTNALWSAPAAAIAPASAAARAVHCALLGVRNSLDPEHKKESLEKYLGPAQFR